MSLQKTNWDQLTQKLTQIWTAFIALKRFIPGYATRVLRKERRKLARVVDDHFNGKNRISLEELQTVQNRIKEIDSELKQTHISS